MALNSYNKNIKLNIDLLGFNTAEKKLKKLEKELNDLRDKRFRLDEEKAKLEKSAEKEKYDRAKKEYEQQRKTLDDLRKIKKTDRTDTQNRQIKDLETSTRRYEDEEAKRSSLYELYKTYGSSEKTKEYDELFSILYRLEEISKDELEVNEEALEIRGKQREAKKEVEDAKNFKKQTQESFKTLTDGIKEKLKESFDDFITGFNDKLKDTLESAIKEYQNVASYSLSTSLKMNQRAREQALTYGLSDAQNYALTKAMEEIGANSVEDLYWMTDAQQERFSERIGYWTGQYNSLADKDAFKTLEELQAELNDIKTDFQMEVVQFISNNKETIISALKVGVSALEKIMNLVAWLVGDAAKNEQSSAVSDAINNYSNSSSSNTNVKIDNSFNGVGTDNLAKLRKAGNEVNRQIIKALS